MADASERTLNLYRLVSTLPRNSYPVDLSKLPRNGIYLFFEAGEDVEVDGRLADRIVRVGTHRKDNRFRQRIRQHYGQLRSERGNKNGSVFRMHVGGALLRRIDQNHPELADWYHPRVKGPEQHEIQVSRTLRDRFTFVSIDVPDAGERIELESGLIALLAQHPPGRPSAGWLGHYARSNDIRSSGLWNTQRVNADPLSDSQLLRLVEMIERAR